MKKIISLFALLLITSCASTSDSSKVDTDSSDYGNCGVLNGSFLGDWFDYYKRGVTYMACEKWAEAESDFKEALKVRNQDKRRVYTLGMHWIKNYFPNRELGIALFNQQKHEESLNYFANSYKQFPTAKNRVYWLKAMRAAKGSVYKDDKAPTLKLTQTDKENWVFYVEDATFVDFVTVEGQAFPITASLKVDDTSVGYIPVEKRHTVTVPKKAFNYSDVTVNAVDVFGQSASLELQGENDELPPDITVVGGTKAQNTFNAKLTVSDKSGLKSITWLNQALSGNALKKKKSVLDEDGNIVQVELNVNLPFSENLIVATDKFGNELTYTLTENKIFNDDSISVFLGELPEITQDSFVVLEAEIVAGRGIKYVSINDLPYKLTSEGVASDLHKLVPLQLGPNVIRVHVEDASGQFYDDTVRVTRALAPEFAFDERMRIALLPFDCDGANSVSCMQKTSGYQTLFDGFDMRKRFQLTSRFELEKAVAIAAECELYSTSDGCLAFIADTFGTDEASTLYQAQKSINEGATAQALLVVEIDRIPVPSSNTEVLDIAIKVIQANTGTTLINFSNYEEVGKNQPLDIESIVSKVHTFFPVFVFEKHAGRQVSSEVYQPWEDMPVIGKDNDVCYIGKIKKDRKVGSWQYSESDSECSVTELVTF